MSGDAADELEIELRRELPPSHVLCGLQLRAVARRENRDDVLFQSADADGDGPVFCVHRARR